MYSYTLTFQRPRYFRSFDKNLVSQLGPRFVHQEPRFVKPGFGLFSNLI